jgi:hypothetical protein
VARRQTLPKTLSRNTTRNRTRNCGLFRGRTVSNSSKISRGLRLLHLQGITLQILRSFHLARSPLSNSTRCLPLIPF